MHRLLSQLASSGEVKGATALDSKISA